MRSMQSLKKGVKWDNCFFFITKLTYPSYSCIIIRAFVQDGVENEQNKKGTQVGNHRLSA